MCTLSWSFHPTGYSVFFNRDELNQRAQALPPQQRTIGGVRIIAPQDAEKGGSWIVVNEYGVLTCLLNLYEYPIPETDEPYLSRGYLVMDLASCEDWTSSVSILNGKDLGRYPPFQLFQFTTDCEVHCLKWTGRERQTSYFRECLQPISGSSFRNEDVVARRIEAFRECTSEAFGDDRLQQLERFHLSHNPDGGAHSVNMCRADARTVSISRIDVEPQGVRFQYRQKGDRCFEFDAPILVTMDR